MRIDGLTRSLHICMVITVLFQMLSSLWMFTPEPGKMVGYETILYSWHIMFIGWSSVTIACVYAMLRFAEYHEWTRLIPWFSASKRALFLKSAKEEIPGVFKGELAPPENRGALAGAMHGFGFLLLIAMGLTGSYAMLGIRPDGTTSADMTLMFELHSWGGVFVWFFLTAHVSMVIYHVILGHYKVLDVFQIRQKK
ncbi:MAG: cytochrome b/b6 domain-containing protein [Mariprofundaceae bacterium]|nr:cytochrome b/b6 domain-containing protein [Mariprofundaceae bacterium]